LEQLAEYEPATLVHWTYTRDEWRRFIRRTNKKKGLLHYLLHLFSPERKKIPEVKITPLRVSIGDNQHHFSSNEHEFKRIDIRDEGEMNVMNITYRWSKRKDPGLDEIRILVPKGKLKEAIEVETRLNKDLEFRNS
jgi:hypothetical protein